MLADILTSTQGIVAVTAGAVAVVAIVWCIALTVALRRVRATQSIVIGSSGARDLVAHATDLQQAFVGLRDQSTEMAELLQQRLSEVERSLLTTLSNRALVHYDAYNELSGRQSMSIALLDGTRSGIVISCIHHRDQARVYAKHVREGEGEVDLSPEEAEAVRIAAPNALSSGEHVERAG